MDKNDFVKALENLKKQGKQRKFKQGIDLIINLRDLNLKKPEHQVELFIQLKFKPKKARICAIVGPELKEQAKANCDFMITLEDFPDYSEKNQIKKLANEYDWFIAQATIMPQIAKAFGRVFGPKGKMPNPKAGCVVPPNANLKIVCEKLRNTVKISAKVQPSIKLVVGKEGMPDEQVLDNILSVYSAVRTKLPHEDVNIKNILLKLTMSKPIVVGAKEEKEKGEKK